jgi:DNA-binding CsgD family transcriptional regulator
VKSGGTTRTNEQLPLLERERELEILSSALTEAREGTGSLLIVEGPAGIGKTSLLHEVAALGEEAGCLVRAARSGEMERDLPFGVVRQLFEPLVERASEEERKSWLSGSARQAKAVLGGAEHDPSQATDPFAAINGLYWLVSNLSASQPVALVIDDAQWSDTASLRFARFLARRLSDLAVSLILGVRTGEPNEPAEVQALRVEAAVLHLEPLSHLSVKQLIEKRTGEVPSDEFSEACATASAGNPLFVIEILRDLGSEGRSLDRDAADQMSSVAPDTIARKVLFRLRRFGDEAVAMANAFSVLGRSPQLRHAAQLAELDEVVARKVCDELRRAEILAAGLPIEFVHPVVRQAIYQEQPEEQRSAAHRRGAEILHSTGAKPQEVAAHLLACAPNGDQWVVERLRDAAQVAIDEGALDGAATYLERALKEPPEDDLPVLYLLGNALTESERPYDAPRILAEVAERATDAELRLDSLRRLYIAQLATGDFAGTTRTCDLALDAVGGKDPEVALHIEAERFWMLAASRRPDPEESKRIENVAAPLAGTTSGERVARQALSLLRYVTCAPVEEVIDLVLPSPEFPWMIRGIELAVPIGGPKLLCWSGRWDDARREWEGYMEWSRGRGRILNVSIAHSFLAEVDRMSGRLYDSEALARTGWEIAQLPEGLSPYRWSAMMNLAATLLARGDLEGFTVLMGDFDLSMGPTEVPVNPWPLELRAYLRKEQGDLEGSLEDFLKLGDALEHKSWLNPSLPPHWRQEATELLAALGRADEAREIISVAEDRANAFGAPHTIASVLRARAMIEPSKRAIGTLKKSIALFETAGPPHELARSLLALGGHLRRAGDRSEAREMLGRALEIAHVCGAGSLEKKIRDELAAAGARPRRVARTGVGALTASELRTAKLASSGLSNREVAERLFVSVRTVETHLTHVYEKLAITGRRALADTLAESA